MNKFMKERWDIDHEDGVIIGDDRNIAHIDPSAEDSDVWLILMAPHLFRELKYVIDVVHHGLPLGETWIERASILLNRITKDRKDN